MDTVSSRSPIGALPLHEKIELLRRTFVAGGSRLARRLRELPHAEWRRFVRTHVQPPRMRTIVVDRFGTVLEVH
jgi:hypothetical protein